MKKPDTDLYVKKLQMFYIQLHIFRLVFACQDCRSAFILYMCYSNYSFDIGFRPEMSKNYFLSFIITQPAIYRVIAYFSLYHELVSHRSIVLDITWNYTMAWYPAQKDNIQWPGTQFKRCQCYSNVSLCHRQTCYRLLLKLITNDYNYFQSYD